ncbi:lytic polysaccharide monooxygenase [Auriscalpium vulgare]|uniref:Lytic polysaccharide monooxygenase n=1 Tax=Auriscalpium vulgare TaxID=40419 RepID=A0ACB8RGG4_9AGAM|nr:lytic polysaccharide monooxygenase [Auriscalpium vulgare]
MKAPFASLASFVVLASSVSAKTVFSAVSVNGVYEGLGTGVRVPVSNSPVTNVTSDDIICNTGFEQPVSSAVLTVPAGGTVSAIFHHTSAGYVGPDPADPIDPTDKGPLTAYLAAIPSATQSDVTGLKWFKIWEDGLLIPQYQWGSDRLFINNGSATFTIPSCIPSGQYLLRVEDIALQNAASYPGAQFYLSCAQIQVINGGTASPATVSIPGVYTASSPGIIVPNVYTVDSYTVPGPAVFTC